MVDLEHAHVLQLVGEPQRAAVVAGPEDYDLLDAVGRLGQERVVEAAGSGDGKAVAAGRGVLEHPAEKRLGENGSEDAFAQADEALGETVLARNRKRGLICDRRP